MSKYEYITICTFLPLSARRFFIFCWPIMVFDQPKRPFLVKIFSKFFLKIQNELQSVRKGARTRKLFDLFSMSSSSLLFSTMSKTQLENSQKQMQAAETRWQQRTFMRWLQFTQSQNEKSKTCHPMLLQERMEFIFRRNF